MLLQQRNWHLSRCKTHMNWLSGKRGGTCAIQPTSLASQTYLFEMLQVVSSFVAKSKIKQSIPLFGHTKYEGKTRRKLAWLSIKAGKRQKTTDLALLS